MTDAMTSLYSAWFDTLPEAFRALVPTPGAAAPAAAPATSNGRIDAVSRRSDREGIQRARRRAAPDLPELSALLAQGPLTAEPLLAMAQAATQAWMAC